jgi:hypothetical protein
MDVSIDEVNSTVRVVDADSLFDRRTVAQLVDAVLERLEDARKEAAVRRLDDDDEERAI